MGKMTIQKNKGEVFKCHFDVVGVQAEDVKVRLCLEFNDNKNLHFYGKLSENGDCEIQIPRLSDCKSNSGKLVVEAVADTMYFKLYECDFDLKNAVEVRMAEVAVKDQSEAQVSVSNIQIKEKETAKQSEEPITETEEKKPENPFISKKLQGGFRNFHAKRRS